MLEQEGIYNDLSPKLREKVEARINSFGKTVRYKFNLARPNPDPQKYNGAIIYPSLYNLHPVQWKITDNDETEERLKSGKQKVKNIAVIESVEKDDRGNPVYRFKGVKISDIEKGIKVFDMDNEEDRSKVASLELHPKNGNGMFPNKQMVAMFSRVDETELATKERSERSARKKAMDIAEAMSDKEVVDFADGMATDEWDSTQDLFLLRNMVEKIAETNPELFNDKVHSKQMEIQATIKKAIANRIVSHNPAEGSLSWTNTQQVIIALGAGFGDKNDVERFAEWFITAGKRADEAYKKIKSLIEKPVSV